MQDRVPLYPGRVKLIPVSGQENTYDMVRSDEPTQEGDPLSKATFLKDLTAALYGLGTDAVPDDVLAWIGKYNQHWWRRRSTDTIDYLWSSDRHAYQDSGLGGERGYTLGTAENVTLSSSNGVDSGDTIKYADEIIIADDESVVLSEPVSVEITFNNYTNANALKGKFIRCSDNKVYYITENAADATTEYKSSYFYVYIYAAPVTGYLNPDGYEYEYLGVPFLNAAESITIETGSYVGTGTYGAENKTSITFPFKPKLVIIRAKGFDTTTLWMDLGDSADLWSSGDGYVVIDAASAMNSVSRYAYLDKTTLYFWAANGSSSGPGYQFNSDGVEYYYLAIGRKEPT